MSDNDDETVREIRAVDEALRRTVRGAGQSIQAYMLACIVEMGRRPTPPEVVAALRADLEDRQSLEVDPELLLRDRDSGRR